MKKKKWEKPKLIILTRGKPEERVLMQCKGAVATGYEALGGLCYYQFAEGCDYCSSAGPPS